MGEESYTTLPYRDLGHARVREILSKESQYESVSDLLADIIYFCDKESITFQNAVDLAVGYVEDEQAEDVDVNGEISTSSPMGGPSA